MTPRQSAPYPGATSSPFSRGLASSASPILLSLGVGLTFGLFEEIGWSGFAVPRMRPRHTALTSGIVVGLVWGAWHLLLFWESDSFSALLPFALLRSRGSSGGGTRVRGRVASEMHKDPFIMSTIVSPRPFHGEALSRHTKAGTLRKALLVCGILSSLAYVAADVVAGLSWPAYSFASQTISELSAIGAPSRWIWLAFGIPYDVLLIAFGVGVWGCAGRKRGLRVTAALLIAIGAIGSLWPPMHVRGSVTTLTDTLHVVWAGLISLFILLAIGFGAGAFGKRFRWYSIATIAVLLVSGTLTSFYGPRIAANQPTPWVGVFERIDLAGYLVWAAVLAIVLLRAKAPEGGET